MDALLLSRIQFGVSIGFHYLFPLTTLGLAFFIVLFEGLGLITHKKNYRTASSFLVSILALMFTVGVATGLMMPFAIGGNWARFSTAAGAIFGPGLAIEAISAFALESVFMAILAFGRSRVSPRLYFIAALCVFTGAHLSAFLIVAVNSWMQTPAGFIQVNNQLVMTSFLHALFNPSTFVRFVHVITGAWMTGAFIVAAIGAFYAARKQHNEIAALLLKIALPVALCTALVQPSIGHAHILNVREHNPEKDAAYEGIFYTTKGAPLYAMGIPDEKHKTIHLAIGIPFALSFLESGNPFSEVKGITDFPYEVWPPVNIIFTTFHVMVMLGIIMIVVSACGIFLLYRKKLFSTNWFLYAFPWFVIAPFMANEVGWMGTEIGRQPWAIYNVLRTAQASSVALPAWQIATTLIGICILYAGICFLTFKYLMRIIITGPAKE